MLKKRGVVFLYENNVLTKENIREDKILPLLCIDSDEILEVQRSINHTSVGVLLDTGHLKVSAHTLSFDLREALKKISSLIKYIHHSDNNSLVDSNSPLTEDYWFLEFMSSFIDVMHVIEVKNQSIDQLKIQEELLRSCL